MPASTRNPLFVPNLMQLRDKLNHPHPGLCGWIARFRQQLASDVQFRRQNIYLEVLLGDRLATDQAREQVLADAADLARRSIDDSDIEHHVWCVAPRAMRLAVYHDWLMHAGAITSAEQLQIGESLLTFVREHVVNVLRSRTPVADNQSWSMALSTAVIGLAFADIDPLRDLAVSLQRFGMRRLFRVLRLLPQDGYLLEGSTYQSHVVSPLAMWTASLLSSIHGPQALTRRFSKCAATLLEVLRVESLLGSPASLLPPWDHYGWQPKVNISPIAYLASVLNDGDESSWLLDDVSECWDRSSYIAWCGDDRMWALIYWPQASPAATPTPRPVANRWVLPRTAAALDHYPTRSRLFMCWDRTAECLQAAGRMQMNANHVTWEAHGRAITADGILRKSLPPTPDDMDALVRAVHGQRDVFEAHYGDMKRWVQAVLPGLPLWSNSTLPEDGERWFACGAQGHLVGQWRLDGHHVVIAEARSFWSPRWNFSAVRRAVAMSDDGIAWMVDHVESDSPLAHLWQMHLRPRGGLNDRIWSLSLGGAAAVTLGWLPGPSATMQPVDGFPASWGDGGSDDGTCDRLRLRVVGRQALFAVCLLPCAASDLVLSGDARRMTARWDGGQSILTLPDNWTTLPLPAVQPELTTVNDLHHEPWVARRWRESDMVAHLDRGDPKHWRRTVEAMQSLTLRGHRSCMPRIYDLLCDPGQPYQVHAVAAWCLGRAAWSDAQPQLRKLAESPELNTAMRCRFALDAIVRAQRSSEFQGTASYTLWHD